MSKGHQQPSRSRAASRRDRPDPADRTAPRLCRRRSQEKGMASKSATATKAKVNEKEVPEKEAAARRPRTARCRCSICPMPRSRR